MSAVTRHFGTKTLRHQDSSAPNNWCRSVQTFWHQILLVPKCLVLTLDWCRSISLSFRTRKDNNEQEALLLPDAWIGWLRQVPRCYHWLQIEFQYHIDSVAKKVNGTRAFLNCNLRSWSHSIRDSTYKTYIRPMFEYASTVWDPHIHWNINKLEQVQCHSARYVNGNHDHQQHLCNGTWPWMANIRAASSSQLPNHVVQNLLTPARSFLVLFWTGMHYFFALLTPSRTTSSLIRHLVISIFSLFTFLSAGHVAYPAAVHLSSLRSRILSGRWCVNVSSDHQHHPHVGM